MHKYAVGKAAEIQQSLKKIIEVNGIELGVFYVEGQYYAWRNICPHAAAPVCKGAVCGTRMPSMVYEYEYGQEQQILRCPWHGWEFDLKTGKHLVDDSVKLKGYQVEVVGEEIYVLV